MRGATGGGAGRVRGTLIAETGGKLEAIVVAWVKVGVGGSSIDGISLLGGIGILGLRRVGGLAGGRSNVTDALDDDDLSDLTRRSADGSALASRVVGWVWSDDEVCEPVEESVDEEGVERPGATMRVRVAVGANSLGDTGSARGCVFERLSGGMRKKRACRGVFGIRHDPNADNVAGHL